MYTTMYTMCAVHPCYHLSKITSASDFTQTLTPDPPPAPHFEILFSAIELHHAVPGRRRHLGRVGRRPAPVGGLSRVPREAGAGALDLHPHGIGGTVRANHLSLEFQLRLLAKFC